MQQAPRNFATEAMEASRQQMLGGDPTGMPVVDEELVSWLEKEFPARCYEPDTGETLERHLLYAGGVKLITYLRNVITERHVEAELIAEYDLTGDTI